jgi:succinate dehydrogenase/fumarate reductase cytochrome b subunit
MQSGKTHKNDWALVVLILCLLPEVLLLESAALGEIMDWLEAPSDALVVAGGVLGVLALLLVNVGGVRFVYHELRSGFKIAKDKTAHPMNWWSWVITTSLIPIFLLIEISAWPQITEWLRSPSDSLVILGLLVIYVTGICNFLLIRFIYIKVKQSPFFFKNVNFKSKM